MRRQLLIAATALATISVGLWLTYFLIADTLGPTELAVLSGAVTTAILAGFLGASCLIPPRLSQADLDAAYWRGYEDGVIKTK